MMHVHAGLTLFPAVQTRLVRKPTSDIPTSCVYQYYKKNKAIIDNDTITIASRSAAHNPVIREIISVKLIISVYGYVESNGRH